MSDVRIVRLTSGEEIIANVTEAADRIDISDASVLIPSPEGKLLLAKWLPYANLENGLTLDKKHIVFIIKAQRELEDHFTNVVMNNLVVPGKKILTPNLKLTPV